MSRKNQIYTNEFKLKVFQSYLNGEGSYRSIAEKFNIRNKTQVENWVEKY